MNVPTWVAWIIVAILAVLSILIFTGKAPFLIAGFNTASKEERSKYSIKKLSRVVGGGFGVITVIEALVVFYNAELPRAIAWLMPWGLFGTIAIMLILANTICRES